MPSRARMFAAITFLIGWLAGPAVWAQAQNLEAGKSPSQLFAGACNACHKSPRGLLKSVSPASLPDFLKEHYTTSGEMASQLATYLISNGASDGRQAKQGADKQGQGGGDQVDHQGRKSRNPPSQEAARPDDTPPAAEGGRQGRKRQARPAESPDEGKPAADAPAQTDTERASDGRRLSAKQRKKPAKPGAEEPSLAREPARTEPAKTEPAEAEPAKTEPAKAESDDKATVPPGRETGSGSGRPDADMKPRDEVKSAPAASETAKTEAPADGSSGDKPAMRHDSEPAATASPPAAAATPAPPPAVASEAASEPAASPAPAPATAEPQAVTASVPPPRPAGPPAPPISQ